MKLKLLLIFVMLLLVPLLVNADLIAHYLCDETSGTVLDNSMNASYDGTVSNALLWDASGGKIGGACYFNDLYYADDINYGGVSNWTIAFWYKPDVTYSGVNNWFISRSSTSPNYGGTGTLSNTGIETMNSAGAQYTFTVPNMGAGVWHHVIVTSTSGVSNVYLNNTASVSNPTDRRWDLPNDQIVIGGYGVDGRDYMIDGKMDDIRIYNEVITAANRSFVFNDGAGTQNNFTTDASDTTPPAINQNSYNMTSEGSAGCVNWRTNPATPCSTSDTTPTVNFTTTEPVWCAIGTQSINFTQYVNLGVDRNCTIGQGTSSHTCTLVPDDELTFANSNIYIGCRDSSGNENTTGKSTSGPLSLTITGLEAGSDSAIGRGVQNALLSGYTNHTNQQIYARKLDGTQDFGTFDWMAKKGSKVWAFNYITSGEAHVGLFNITPVLYVLEMSNITNSTIINKVELMINATK